MMENNWLKDIHNRMADFEIEEPQGLWEDICAAETKGAKIPAARSTWGKRIGIVSGIAAVGLFLLGVFLHDDNGKGNSPIGLPPEHTMIAKESTNGLGDTLEKKDGKMAEDRSDKTNVLTMEKRAEEQCDCQ